MSESFTSQAPRFAEQRIQYHARAVLVVAIGGLSVHAMSGEAIADTPDTKPAQVMTVKYPEKTNFKSDGENAPIFAAFSGLPIGQVERDTQAIAVSRSESGEWIVVGLIHKDNSTSCAVIEKAVLSVDIKDMTFDADHICKEEARRMKNYFRIGHNFNCRMSKADRENNCVSFSPLFKTVEGCDLRLWGRRMAPWKDYSNMDYPRTKGGVVMPMGSLPADEWVSYRYVTPDEAPDGTIPKNPYEMAMISMTKGIRFVHPDCIPPEVRYGRTGGIIKTDETVGGSSPNARASVLASRILRDPRCSVLSYDECRSNQTQNSKPSRRPKTLPTNTQMRDRERSAPNYSTATFAQSRR